jgi:hypothetical protein
MRPEIDLRSAARAMILRLLQLGLAVMPALCVPAVLPRNALCIVSQPKDPHVLL